jgi:serine/threonine-protein kinase HipA
MSMDLTLQICIGGTWHRAAVLEFLDPEKGANGGCNFEYDLDHVTSWIGRDAPFAAASLRLPVEFGPKFFPRWPAFLDDIRPMGSAHRWWLQRLGLRAEPKNELEVLRRGTVAPIGNLRIEEAVPPRIADPRRFPRQAVIEREHGFLDHAAELGAQVGGATGAGGEAPKILVRLDASDQVWIDLWQDEPTSPDRHYLVKFARGNSDRDRLILRSEFVYYRALTELGVETIPVKDMSLEEGPSGPSLWLPRFDVARKEGREFRWGMESLYSLVQAEPGAWLRHQQALAALQPYITPDLWRDVLLDYLRRDLLNLVFGNSDNHGRNMAVLKSENSVKLAPIFDFAPMQMDLEGITRTTKWAGFETGGSVDWPGLLRSFGSDEDFLRDGLHALAVRLERLPELLMDLGLPEETLDFPSMGLRRTGEKLRAWMLL